MPVVRPVPRALQAAASASPGERGIWIGHLRRLADPVLKNLAAGTLKARMPVEQAAGANRRNVTHLEALGRLVAGLAPWVELGADASAEGRLRADYADLALRAISRAVDPSSPDFLNFTRDRQPLVDAAFLAQGLLRAPRPCVGRSTRRRAGISSRRSSRPGSSPGFNNWLLFSAMVEAGLTALGATWDRMRVDYALRQHDHWYKGDGAYGDGPAFHWDYYNSFVIQPMLLDVLDVVRDDTPAWKELSTRFESARAAMPRCRSGSSRRTAASRHRSLARVPLRRVPAPAGARCGTAPGRRLAGAGPRRPDRGHSPDARGAGHFRCRRLASNRVLRPPAGSRRNLHFDREPLSLLRRIPAARPRRDRSVLVRAAAPWTSVRAWSGQPFPIDHAISAISSQLLSSQPRARRLTAIPGRRGLTPIPRDWGQVSAGGASRKANS